MNCKHCNDRYKLTGHSKTGMMFIEKGYCTLFCTKLADLKLFNAIMKETK